MVELRIKYAGGSNLIYLFSSIIIFKSSGISILLLLLYI